MASRAVSKTSIVCGGLEVKPPTWDVVTQTLTVPTVLILHVHSHSKFDLLKKLFAVFFHVYMVVFPPKKS